MDFGLFIEFTAPEGTSDQETFARGFQLVDEAESMGVDSIWLAEYHFSPFSVLSAPITVATAVASRTERARIGFGVLLLPLSNPVRVAEEVATLDHISQGRIDFGIGRGTFPDHHDAFNSPYPESRGRFEEYLDIILQAWTKEKVSFEGEHYQCNELNIKPKPLQSPHPPIRVGITSAETFPIVGRMGYPIFINPSRVFALSELASNIDSYRSAWKDAGHEGDGNVGLRIPVYVAETASWAGWGIRYSSTPPGCSPSPNWRPISTATGRRGRMPATRATATWACEYRSTLQRPPSRLTTSRERAPLPRCRASALGSPAALTVRARPATGGRRRIGSAV